MNTDRTFYLAGESIWLSLYCFDLSDNEHLFSNLSNVVYVELHNPTSVVLTAKLRLEHGRGSGKLDLLPTLPTGNYRLIAYTKQMLNEDSPYYFDKIIPIYNTLSMERTPQNVSVAVEAASKMERTVSSSSTNNIEIKLGVDKANIRRHAAIPVSLINKSEDLMTLSMSVVRVDVESERNSALPDFLAEAKAGKEGVTFSDLYIPEYEGEIIRGRVGNIDIAQTEGKSIFLSAVGKGVDLYASSIDSASGEFIFFTNSLYGDREVVLEYPYDSDREVVFELFDPFVRPAIKPIPPLHLDKAYGAVLLERSVEMQVSHRFGIDTLNDWRIISDDPLIYNKPTVYKLDNFTRFPNMQDVMVECVKEMRFRRVDNKPVLQIAADTDMGWVYAKQNSLVIIDGIAIFNHGHLLKYDPLKVETITIYRNSFNIGGNTFGSIAKFNTYKGNYLDLVLDKGVKIVDFHGVQYPCRFTAKEMERMKHLPDIRSLLYWDPCINLVGMEDRNMQITTSSVPGKYVVVLEGITHKGAPVYYRSEFEVQ